METEKEELLNQQESDFSAAVLIAPKSIGTQTLGGLYFSVVYSLSIQFILPGLNYHMLNFFLFIFLCIVL